MTFFSETSITLIQISNQYGGKRKKYWNNLIEYLQNGIWLKSDYLRSSDKRQPPWLIKTNIVTSEY
jgi:hypothetical protein